MGYLLIRLPAPPAHADGRVLLFQADHVGVPVDNVVVLIDYENIRQSGYRGTDDRNSVFDPVSMAELVVRRRKQPSRLKSVRVYRGIPNRKFERGKARADRLQRERWLRDTRVAFIGRDVQYRGEPPRPREKGIDTALAIDLVALAFWSESDVFIVASRDTDLEPAIELVMSGKLGNRVVEVVGVKGLSRLRCQTGPVPWCHYLSREDFEAIRDDG